MNSASLLRFLEDFGHGGAPAGAPASAQLVAMPHDGDIAAVNDDQPSLEQRLAEAREEGARQAREEMTVRHRAELLKLKTELESAAQKARDAEMAMLTETTDALFAQYDAWLDRLFETSLRPLIAGTARDVAFDALKTRILEAAGSRNLAVALSGPQDAVARMAAMLGSAGLEVDAKPDASTELCAEIDGQSLQTRFGRVEELLSSGLKQEPEARDD